MSLFMKTEVTVSFSSFLVFDAGEEDLEPIALVSKLMGSGIRSTKRWVREMRL
jgi:hypothetical protein